jgi:hypothetical protein
MNSHEGLVLLYGTPEEYIRLMTKLNKTEFVVIERLELTIDDSFNGNIGKLLITYKINQSI